MNDKLSNAYFTLFDSNMLISNITTVICLDDYHSQDRTGRKKKGVTMLDPRANDFDLMYKQMKAIKEGKAVRSLFTTMFLISSILLSSSSSPKILVIDGLHPIFSLQLGVMRAKKKLPREGVLRCIKQVCQVLVAAMEKCMAHMPQGGEDLYDESNKESSNSNRKILYTHGFKYEYSLNSLNHSRFLLYD